MLVSRNKSDLIIEKWEELDCESVGRVELEAIEAAVRERFGEAAVDRPMTLARCLADEGAVLRHSEIMQLHLERFEAASQRDPAFLNILNVSSLQKAAASLRDLENLRRKYAADGDAEGLRLVTAKAREGREIALAAAARPNAEETEIVVNNEIAEWFTIWLQSPVMFGAWIEVRLASKEFIERFGYDAGEDTAAT